jgi:hypothetical protein
MGLKGASVLAAAAALAYASPTSAEPINQVPYATLTGTALITFEDVAADANFDTTFESGGALFGERFVGQTLSFSGDHDVLSGTPTNALTAQAGAAGQNLSTLTFNASNVLTGLGPLGYPNANAVGEGSFSVLFDFNQSEFGFQLVGGDLGSATVDFFRRDGSLISSVEVTGLTNDFYGFQREGGVSDIAGISIYNIDAAGIGFDNLRHSVQGVVGEPEVNVVPLPGAFWGGMALVSGLGLNRFRRRTA